MEFRHIPVLLNEVIEALAVRADGIYVDGTVGGGGHSREIARRLSAGRLIGIDRDESAVLAAKKALLPYSEKVTIVKGNFKDIKKILHSLNIEAIDGALLDLGVSSYQIDEAERGFSYMADAPLDMRMDQSADLSAYDVVNGYSLEQLARIIYEYGEERWGRRIAKFIVQRRAVKPIATTGELADIIDSAIPKGARQQGHPAKRTFQAIRIEVNGELAVLEQAVKDFADVLKPGGRLAVITFHSLEDRIVKRTFSALESGCTCPSDFPVCVCGRKPMVRIINKKPILPDNEEVSRNTRSKSAKLRVVEKI